MEETKYRLSDIADVQTGPFGSQLHNEDYVSSGTPIVTVEHLGNRKFTTQNLPMVSDDDKIRLSKYSLKTGDIVFSRVGSVDRCSYVSDDENGWLFSGRCLRVRCSDKVMPLYLYYFFCLPSVKQYIRNIAVGATMPSINTSLLSEIQLELPDMSTQRTVAGILSSIDDKIELNKRINDNLEQQAQALFRSWFIDFNPFKEGKFAESELGMIPEGWRVGTLGDLVEIKYGKDHKKLQDGSIPVFGSGGIMRYAEKPLYSEESVLIPRKGTLNNVIYVNKPFWTVDTMFYTVMKIPGIAKFIYLFVNPLDLASMNSGSAVPSMTTEILNGIKLVIPANEVLKQFTSVVSPLFVTHERNESENRNLAELRDSLLPKLMSGELKIEEMNR